MRAGGSDAPEAPVVSLVVPSHRKSAVYADSRGSGVHGSRPGRPLIGGDFGGSCFCAPTRCLPRSAPAGRRPVRSPSGDLPGVAAPAGRVLPRWSQALRLGHAHSTARPLRRASGNAAATWCAWAALCFRSRAARAASGAPTNATAGVYAACVNAAGGRGAEARRQPKGVAELGICGVAAAVANVIYNATGVPVRDYPITLDKLLGRLPDVG